MTANGNKEDAMRHLRRTVFATLAIALCTAPVAAADNHHRNGGGAVVAPARGGGLTGGEMLGEDWARGLARPSPDPFDGGCRPFVGNVLTPAWVNGTATCTITKGTRLFIFFGSFCSDLDDPASLKTEEDQLACAVAADQAIQAFSVTVDRRTINIRTRRFELFSPQRRAQLTADNFYGVPAGTTLTFTAHAWGAVIKKLRPGQHTVTMEVVAPEWDPDPLIFTINLTVVRGGGSGEDN
jgi:hypothetical protein